MSIPSMIDFRIRDIAKTEDDYIKLRDELEMCSSGELAYDQLSPDAQEIWIDYEGYMSDMADMAREDDEEYRIGPLDV